MTRNLILNSSGLALCVLLTSCSGGGGSGQPSGNNVASFDQTGLITNLAGIMQSDFLQLRQSVDDLTVKVDSYCGKLGQSDEDSARSEAQASFLTTMNDLQSTVMYNLGPALQNDRMAQLYSWPLTSTCQIDLKLADNQTGLNLAVDKRGIDALEYLLFVDAGGNHSCPSNFVPIPADLLDNFNALSAAEKKQRRCSFMQAVVQDAQSSAQTLANAWDSAQGNYPNTMISASNSIGTLNSVSDAMFYFEEVAKENKLDAPLGGSQTNTAPSCGLGQTCPEDLESRYARISKENLLANIRAFQKLFLGGTPQDTGAIGFDDWLEAEGEGVLATRFAGEIQSVIDGLEAINGSLFDSMNTDAAPLNALLTGPLQDMSQTLRFDFLLPLGLNLPAGSQSDTD